MKSFIIGLSATMLSWPLQAQSISYFQIEEQHHIGLSHTQCGQAYQYYSEKYGGHLIDAVATYSLGENDLHVFDQIPAMLVHSPSESVQYLPRCEFGLKNLQLNTIHGVRQVSFDFYVHPEESMECRLYLVSEDEKKLVQTLTPQSTEYKEYQMRIPDQIQGQYVLEVHDQDKGLRYKTWIAQKGTCGLKLYPNPTADRVSIQLDHGSPDALINVYIPDGRHLSQVSMHSALQSLEIGEWPSGSYIFIVSGTDQYQVLVKK